MTQPPPKENINTLANAIQSEFYTMIKLSHGLDIHASGDYQRGFADGVKALNTRFLRAMENKELVYTRTK